MAELWVCVVSVRRSVVRSSTRVWREARAFWVVVKSVRRFVRRSAGLLCSGSLGVLVGVLVRSLLLSGGWGDGGAAVGLEGERVDVRSANLVSARDQNAVRDLKVCAIRTGIYVRFMRLFAGISLVKSGRVLFDPVGHVFRLLCWQLLACRDSLW